MVPLDRHALRARLEALLDRLGDPAVRTRLLDLLLVAGVVLVLGLSAFVVLSGR